MTFEIPDRARSGRARLTYTRRSIVAGIAASIARPAQAQSFPTRPVRWLCHQAAGGTMDLTMRAVQPFLAAQGVRTQLDYAVGGGGNVARATTYTAAADGYTMMADSAPSTPLGEVVTHASFKTSEIEPIYGWSIEGWQICTQRGAAFKDLKDLVALSQTRPIVAGSIGRGGASHLQLILLRQATGMRMNIVHFSGSAQAYPQVIGGNIDIACTGPGSASRSAEQLQFLCIFRPQERALPGTTSARAQGYDVASIDQVWYSQTTPKVPEDRLVRLETAFQAACQAPGFAEAQAKAGILSVEPVTRAQLRHILDDGYDLAVKYQKELAAG